MEQLQGEETDGVENDQASQGIAKESHTLKVSGKDESCPTLTVQSYC